MHKHREIKWMTYSIINSIKIRDRKYYNLKCMNPHDPDYSNLKQSLSVYNGILKKIIREAKADYYYKTFETYKNDIKTHGKQYLAYYANLQKRTIQ